MPDPGHREHRHRAAGHHPHPPARARSAPGRRGPALRGRPRPSRRRGGGAGRAGHEGGTSAVPCGPGAGRDAAREGDLVRPGDAAGHSRPIRNAARRIPPYGARCCPP
ncbi:hypothetical protein SLNWT_2596 [Streptomyces albus]|uniref:Uncharacterized protein n=1 Tax=Streptomyces albus (strain ATCC 21838 / DSM 41398 / FERM P-419 / JCM 4703 / NBRC 107858) TaxID=1081613 RepID=A0A0B5EXY2_STRA4|nr:hypothetical protein SLNWT_2596 [Streptomyces albus]